MLAFFGYTVLKGNVNGSKNVTVYTSHTGGRSDVVFSFVHHNRIGWLGDETAAEAVDLADD
jgi:hypothetical protein